ncbi:hypothetical protein QGM71_19870 [Virgibacillus sp. C22-A2]|uniref:Uncharacterized protein n=1 Tax=Virgibacillus tibetensis TaxID=3042313 RepID=A0ABU6KKT8_9BACI|nr:hypothetical protein [Virgibacillus sp. C22-A2]
MEVEGNIISGEFDQVNGEFILQRVKHFPTESTLKRNQFNSLYNYLEKHKNDGEGQILTLYDQLLVRLSPEEITVFMDDLDDIRPMYH